MILVPDSHNANGVTNAARLIEQPHAKKLLVIERRSLLRKCAVRPQAEDYKDKPSRPVHPVASHMRRAHGTEVLAPNGSRLTNPIKSPGGLKQASSK